MSPEELTIIIESKNEESAEYNFLKTFIKKIIKKDIDEFVNFYPINGWTNLKNIHIDFKKGEFIQKKILSYLTQMIRQKIMEDLRIEKMR